MATGFAAGALLPVILTGLRRRDVMSRDVFERVVKNFGFIAAFVSSLAGCILALSILLYGEPLHVDLLYTRHFGMMSIHADRLSALFLGTISLLAAAVSVYSLGYATEFLGRRNLGLLVFLYNAFLLSMVSVVVAGHTVLFVFVWEAMSLTTYFLINYDHEDPASRRAAFLYVVMTHIGTALLVVMFMLLYSFTGAFGFESLKSAGPRIPAFERSLIFLCAAIGFGVKAGIIPFHIWLPEAHPAAPSNISALMSGVMIKTGIYGMVRVFFDFLGPDIPQWWGVLILVLAVASSVLGVLYALMEHDLKRLLAFHSIENIGIILMGVGAALLFSSLGNNALAALALIAGLYHVLNHAMFKGLLFLGAGSVLHGTHSRNIEELGGLIKKMPWTSFFFLIGAVAISGLPPLNGFVSEWLTFQALLLGFHISDLVVKIAVPLTVALLALTGALAAACFVKAFGITFLGLPRSDRAMHARESSPTMIAAMASLAIACAVFGLAPGLVVSVLDPIASSLLGTNLSGQVSLNGGMLLVPDSTSTSISPPVLTGLLMAIIAVPLVGAFLLGGRLRTRAAMTWACGLPKIEPRMQYSATGFSKPIRMIFSNIYRATHEIEISEETSPYFRASITYELKTESVFLKHIYEPAYNIIVTSARMFRRIQTGHLQSYLAYIFITLVLLLLFAR
ncbi:MAG: hydrogenase 4 subunit B [Ignavibacteria bacterium GWA2_55_11]|nr:MAG: hydrogenase 4 subunit B [Ignavibacteria bacterium GWA2_55_11]OGU65494.1 MAG: hydrogenase 4 subunit B [Ignavibacteria bacterium RIFCSPHIGHO2_02_FULL_56_12]OGU74708.1 MAG: hydrogenase 4 subunit B [Ignavibacteria bacterium RIFCSPLOWO2_02_FULL_55_14]